MLTGQLFGGTVHWEQLPVYLLAEIAGGLAAGAVYHLIATTRRTVGQASPQAEGVLS